MISWDRIPATLDKRRRAASELLGQLRGGGFASRVFTLSSATFLAQFVGILASPLLARIYTPRDFGIFSVYAAILTIASTVATLKFEWAIVVADHADEAAALMRLCLALAVGSTVLASLTLLAYVAFHGPVPALYWTLPFGLLMTAVGTALTSWWNRAARYGVIATANLVTAVSNAAARVILGLGALGAWGMALADVGSGAVNVALLRNRGLPWTSGVSMRRVFEKYARFPRYSAPAAALNAVFYNCEYVIFTPLFSAPQIGAYFLWNRLAMIPKGFMATAIWQVFLQDASALPMHEIGVRMKARQGTLIALTALPYYSGMIALPGVVIAVFGSQWAPYTQLVVPILIGGHMSLVVSSFSLFVVLRRNRAELLFNGLMPVAKVAALVLAFAIAGTFTAVVWALAGTQVLLFLLLAEWNYRAVGAPLLTFSMLYVRRGLLPAAPFVALLILIGVTVGQGWVFFASLLGVNALYFSLYGWRRLRPARAVV